MFLAAGAEFRAAGPTDTVEAGVLEGAQFFIQRPRFIEKRPEVGDMAENGFVGGAIHDDRVVWIRSFFWRGGFLGWLRLLFRMEALFGQVIVDLALVSLKYGGFFGSAAAVHGLLARFLEQFQDFFFVGLG